MKKILKFSVAVLLLCTTLFAFSPPVDNFENDLTKWKNEMNAFKEVTKDLKTDADWNSMSPAKEKQVNDVFMSCVKAFRQLITNANWEKRLAQLDPGCLGCQAACLGALIQCIETNPYGEWCVRRHLLCLSHCCPEV